MDTCYNIPIMPTPYLDEQMRILQHHMTRRPFPAWQISRQPRTLEKRMSAFVARIYRIQAEWDQAHPPIPDPLPPVFPPPPTLARWRRLAWRSLSFIQRFVFAWQQASC